MLPSGLTPKVIYGDHEYRVKPVCVPINCDQLRLGPDTNHHLKRQQEPPFPPPDLRTPTTTPLMYTSRPPICPGSGRRGKFVVVADAGDITLTIDSPSPDNPCSTSNSSFGPTTAAVATPPGPATSALIPPSADLPDDGTIIAEVSTPSTTHPEGQYKTLGQGFRLRFARITLRISSIAAKSAASLCGSRKKKGWSQIDDAESTVARPNRIEILIATENSPTAPGVRADTGQSSHGGKTDKRDRSEGAFAPLAIATDATAAAACLQAALTTEGWVDPQAGKRFKGKLPSRSADPLPRRCHTPSEPSKPDINPDREEGKRRNRGIISGHRLSTWTADAGFARSKNLLSERRRAWEFYISREKDREVRAREGHHVANVTKGKGKGRDIEASGFKGGPFRYKITRNRAQTQIAGCVPPRPTTSAPFADKVTYAESHERGSSSGRSTESPSLGSPLDYVPRTISPSSASFSVHSSPILFAIRPRNPSPADGVLTSQTWDEIEEVPRTPVPTSDSGPERMSG